MELMVKTVWLILYFWGKSGSVEALLDTYFANVEENHSLLLLNYLKVHKDRKIVIAVLTNRGHPDASNNRFFSYYEPKILDAIIKAIDDAKETSEI